MNTDDVIIKPTDITDGINIFANSTDAQVNNAIKMARLNATGDGITDKDVFFSAVVLYAKHLLYIDWFNGQGGVTAATAFGNSNTIANPNASDEWLNQYNELVANYGSANIHFY